MILRRSRSYARYSLRTSLRVFATANSSRKVAKMIRDYASVREVAREISDAADGALDAYREGRVEEEPQITDRILGAIENRVGGKGPSADLPLDDGTDLIASSASVASYRVVEAVGDDVPYRAGTHINWTARSLKTGSGTAAEEKRHGADLMGVLDINIPGYSVKKGFLAQAKRAEPRRNFRKREWDRLHSQCERMLLRTPDAFVWVYSKSQGIRIFPANSVLTLDSRDIFELYSRSVSVFFEYHIECFVGDRRLNSTEIETLDALAEFPVESILELSARP